MKEISRGGRDYGRHHSIADSWTKERKSGWKKGGKVDFIPKNQLKKLIREKFITSTERGKIVMVIKFTIINLK